MTQSSKVAVLSIGPMDAHQTALSKILQQSGFPAVADFPDAIKCCGRSEAAVSMLRGNRIPIVLCDADFGWRQLLDEFRSMPHPPCLIVTSRLADDRLWSEALNLGAYDVLAKPFDDNEVVRVLNMAWIRGVERSATPLLRKRQPQLQAAAFA